MPDEPLKVLLVEDNPGDARLVGAMLSSNGATEFRMRHVTRLDEAQSILTEEPFDAVLLDLSLPDSNGVETIQHASNRDPQGRTPIIVITGRYTEDESLESMHNGAQDYLLKNNLRPDTLIRSIRFAVERQRLRAKSEASEAAQRQVREIESLEQMAAPATPMVTARAYGFERLSVASTDTFEALVDQYCELVEQAIEERKLKLDGRSAQGLRVMAQRLGFLRAGPRDVVELHIHSIKKLRPVKMTTSYVVAEEARLMLLELMGHLAAYYRDHMVPASRPRSAEGLETRRDQRQP